MARRKLGNVLDERPEATDEERRAFFAREGAPPEEGEGQEEESAFPDESAAREAGTEITEDDDDRKARFEAEMAAMGIAKYEGPDLHPDDWPTAEQVSGEIVSTADENRERMDTDFELQQQFPIPTDLSFGQEDVKPAPEIEAIATDLRDQYTRDFYHLNKTSITFMWKKKGGQRNGAPLRVDTVRTHPQAHYFLHTEFTVYMAADLLRIGKITPTQMRALVFHGLCHIGYNETQDKCKIVDHNVIGFRREIEEFGFYQAELMAAAESFQRAMGMRDAAKDAYSEEEDGPIFSQEDTDTDLDATADALDAAMTGDDTEPGEHTEDTEEATAE